MKPEETANHEGTIRLIVGAGPAGLAVAIELAKQGKKSILIDENPTIGGTIFRHSKRKISSKEDPLANDPVRARAKKLQSEFEQYKHLITFKPNVLVLGVMDHERTLAVLDAGEIRLLSPDHIFICTGCHERGQPFPGWTTPGVISAGGLQLQIKSGFVKPHEPVVIAGTGPLILLLASQLKRVGVQIAGVFEAGRRLDLLKNIWGLLHNPKLFLQGIRLYLGLLLRLVPVHYGWGIVKALSDDAGELNEVVVAPYDKKWRPNKKKSRTIKAKCLAVSYGFAPRLHLCEMIHCDYVYKENLGAFVPERDEWFRSVNKRNVYIAGDCAGLRGAEMAVLEGKVTAIASLANDNDITQTQANKIVEPLFKKIKKLQKFRTALENFSWLQPGLFELPNDDTTICRCENVPFSAIKAAADIGIHTERSLKMATRISMGNCQGKICGLFTVQYMRYKTKWPYRKIGDLRPRFPLIPFLFSQFCTGKEDKVHEE